VSDGLHLLGAIIDTGSIHLLRDLREDYFIDDEVPVYQYMRRHYRRYGNVPAITTVQDHCGVEFPDAVEGVDYYTRRVEDRYIYQYIKTDFTKLKDALRDYDMDRAREVIANLRLTTRLITNATDVRTLGEAANIVLAEYENAHLNPGLSGVPSGLPSLDKSTGGYQAGDLVTYVARPACISGDTELYVSREPKGSGRWYSVVELYRAMKGLPIHGGKGGGKPWDLSKPTKVQCLMGDGLTGLNLVEEVVFSGWKMTYSIVTESGKCLRATADHMMLTPGGYMRLGDMSPGMEVICRADTAGTQPRYTPPYRKEICTRLPYSPYSTRIIDGNVYHRVLEQRAVFDAALNGMSLNEFVEALRFGPSRELVFSERSKHVHHRDGNYWNNDPTNLELLSNSEHGTRHSEEAVIRKHFGKNEVRPEKVVSITPYQNECTYDLVMADPYNNFVAGGMVTHNSGKTYVLLGQAKHAWESAFSVLLVTMEMTVSQITRRMVAMAAGINPDFIRTGRLSYYANRRFTRTVEEFRSTDRFHIYSGGKRKRPSDVEILIQEYRPDIVYVDGMHLMNPDDSRASQRNERVSSIMDSLNQLTIDHTIPIICTTHLNRAAGTKGKAASLETVAYSDAIGTHSSLVLSVSDGLPPHQKDQRILKFIKGREGETGSITTNFCFRPMNFSEAETLPGSGVHAGLTNDAGEASTDWMQT
jgi:replicative DNA helicase